MGIYEVFNDPVPRGSGGEIETVTVTENPDHVLGKPALAPIENIEYIGPTPFVLKSSNLLRGLPVVPFEDATPAASWIPLIPDPTLTDGIELGPNRYLRNYQTWDVGYDITFPNPQSVDTVVAYFSGNAWDLRTGYFGNPILPVWNGPPDPLPTGVVVRPQGRPYWQFFDVDGSLIFEHRCSQCQSPDGKNIISRVSNLRLEGVKKLRYLFPKSTTGGTVTFGLTELEAYPTYAGWITYRMPPPLVYTLNRLVGSIFTNVNPYGGPVFTNTPSQLSFLTDSTHPGFLTSNESVVKFTVEMPTVHDIKSFSILFKTKVYTSVEFFDADKRPLFKTPTVRHADAYLTCTEIFFEPIISAVKYIAIYCHNQGFKDWAQININTNYFR